MTCIHFPTCF